MQKKGQLILEWNFSCQAEKRGLTHVTMQYSVIEFSVNRKGSSNTKIFSLIWNYCTETTKFQPTYEAENFHVITQFCSAVGLKMTYTCMPVTTLCHSYKTLGIRIIFANVIINLLFYNMNFILVLHAKNWVADPLQIKVLEFIYQGEFTPHLDFS